MGEADALEIDRQDIDTPDLAARLRLSTTRLARQLRKASDTGLTPSQYSALITIEHHGPVTLGALAAHERVTPPSITRIVAKLEEDGFVRRATDATDRRVGRVAVTPKGASLIARSRRRRNEWLAARLGDLPADDVARLAAALGVLEALAEPAP